MMLLVELYCPVSDYDCVKGEPALLKSRDRWVAPGVFTIVSAWWSSSLDQVNNIIWHLIQKHTCWYSRIKRLWYSALDFGTYNKPLTIFLFSLVFTWLKYMKKKHHHLYNTIFYISLFIVLYQSTYIEFSTCYFSFI